MKILLIRPPRIKNAISIGYLMYCEPLGLEMLSTILKPKNEIEIFDMIVDKQKLITKLKNYKPNVVGITSIGIDVEIIKKMSHLIKNFNSKIIIIIGGTQTFLDESVFFNKYIDHVVKYTNKNNISKLFYHINTNPPKINGIFSKINNFKGTKIQGYNEYIFPDRKSTKKYRKHYSYYDYQPVAIMQTSQGCSNRCNFCLRWKLEGHNERYFNFNSIKKEIKSINEKTIMIFDNDFLHEKKRLAKLCNFLEQEKINKNFICYGTVKSILKNKKEIERFSKLGLVSVLVGFESFNDKELKFYGNKNTNNDNFKANELLKKLNIKTYASFILNPNWNKKSFKKFRKNIKLFNADITSISPLQPFYGSSIYNKYKNRLIVPIHDYKSWNLGTVVIKPSKMKLSSFYFQILITIIYLNLDRKSVV